MIIKYDSRENVWFSKICVLRLAFKNWFNSIRIIIHICNSLPTVASSHDVTCNFITGDAQFLDPNPYSLTVGSVIEYGEPIQYGVIKWIGHLPGVQGLHAGVEMVGHTYICNSC